LIKFLQSQLPIRSKM